MNTAVSSRWIPLQEQLRFSQQFPQGHIARIDLDAMPLQAMDYFESMSRQGILPEHYTPRNFSDVFLVTEPGRTLTYVVAQEKKHGLFDEEEAERTEQLIYLFTLSGQEYFGRGELRFYPESKHAFFERKPFVGYTETREDLRGHGLGTRRLYLMNALTHLQWGLPLHSSMRRPMTEGIWQNLVEEGAAEKYVNLVDNQHISRYRFR